MEQGREENKDLIDLVSMNFNVLESRATLCQDHAVEDGHNEPTEGWALYNLIPHDINWKPRYMVLQGDSITFYKDETQTKLVRKLRLAWISVQEPPATTWVLFSTGARKKGFLPKGVYELVVNLWSSEGRAGDLCWANKDDAHSWLASLEFSLNEKYPPKILAEKKAAAEKMVRYMKTEHSLLNLWEVYEEVDFTTGLLTSGNISKCQQNNLKLRLYDGKWVQVQVLLCEGELRILLKEKLRMFRIILRTVISSEISPNSIDVFVIVTPSYDFHIQCKHEIAAVDWVNTIRQQRASRDTTIFKQFITLVSPISDSSDSLDILPQELLPVTVAQHNCYIYDGKPVLKNCWVGLVKESSGKIKRKKKIKKDKFTIGRSSTCNFKLTDPYVSRVHCKIVIVDNVPYLCDIGQSASGTELNSKQVTRSPLAPGDIISIGNTKLMFGVTKKVKFAYAEAKDLPSSTKTLKRLDSNVKM